MTQQGKSAGANQKRRSTVERVFVAWIVMLVLLVIAVIVTGVLLAGRLQRIEQRLETLESARPTRTVDQTTPTAGQPTKAEQPAGEKEAGPTPVEKKPPGSNDPATHRTPEHPREARRNNEQPEVERWRVDMDAAVARLKGFLAPSEDLGVELRNASDASAVYDHWIRAQPDAEWPPTALPTLAVAALLLGDFERAETFAATAEQRGVSVLTYYEAAARRAVLRGDYESAVAAARAWWEQTAYGPAAAIILARAHLLRGEVGAAAQSVDQAAPFEGLATADLLALGLVVVGLDRLDALQPIVAEAQTVHTPLQGTFLTLLTAVSAIHRGDGQRAEELLRELRGSIAGANEYDVTLWLGRAIEQQRRPNEARLMYQQATSLEPARPEAWRVLGVLELNLNNADEAKAALDKCVEVAPEYAFGWEALGMAASNANQAQEAIDHYLRAVDAYPLRAETHLALAIAAAKIREKDLAADALRNAFALDASLLDKARRAVVITKLLSDKELANLLPGAEDQEDDREQEPVGPSAARDASV